MIRETGGDRRRQEEAVFDALLEVEVAVEVAVEGRVVVGAANKRVKKLGHHVFYLIYFFVLIVTRRQTLYHDLITQIS